MFRKPPFNNPYLRISTEYLNAQMFGAIAAVIPPSEFLRARSRKGSAACVTRQSGFRTISPIPFRGFARRRTESIRFRQLLTMNHGFLPCFGLKNSTTNTG